MAKRYVIRGASMWPFLKDGQIVSPAEVDKLELGDIVVFTTQENMKVFHRIVLLNKRQTQCKGDNCLHFDGINYNFGSNYQVIRHRFKERVAKISKFYGEHYFRRYKKNPQKYQQEHINIKFLNILQRISMYIIYIAYLIRGRKNKNG